MAPHITKRVSHRLGSWIAALALATGPQVARAQAASRLVQNYRAVFEACRSQAGVPLLAIRRMDVGGQGMRLAVDPVTLATSLEADRTLSCTDTNDAQQTGTRYLQAIRVSTASAQNAGPQQVVANGGLQRGSGPGTFLTADLCPSRRPLDRAFLEKLQSPLPVALAISGIWLTHHRADFQWLLNRRKTGALEITWIDHSYSHPYEAGRPLAKNFLLTPGTDMRTEILDTEKLLVAQGETPSVFFRFPGLISSPALMRTAADNHLVVLGAGAWLARSARVRRGDIILIHLNGNEPAGLKIFADLRVAGKLPFPFRAVADVP
jgi:hypothetical protein